MRGYRAGPGAGLGTLGHISARSYMFLYVIYDYICFKHVLKKNELFSLENRLPGELFSSKITTARGVRASVYMHVHTCCTCLTYLCTLTYLSVSVRYLSSSQ